MTRKITEPVNIRNDRAGNAPTHSHLAEEREALGVILSAVSLEKLLERLSEQQTVGRSKLPREPMVRAFIVGRICGNPTIKGLVRELNDNPAMGELCGFNVIGYAGILPVYSIPSRRTFGRVHKDLQQPENSKLIEECMAELTVRMFEQSPDFGKNIAIDSTTIPTYSNRNSGTDTEASWGFKHSVRSESGTEWVLGYKIHTITDINGCYITGIITTGSTHDSPMLPYLLKNASSLLGDKFAPQSAAADKGYDSKANHELLHSKGIAPLIPLRKMSKSELRQGKYTDDGVPTCYGLEMQYVSTDEETGKHLYRCPVDNHIPKWQMLPCNGKEEVDPEDDIRLFGGAIRRGSPEWKEKYKGRYGVERLYAWWKVGRNLEGHYFRGKANIKLFTMLTALGYQARQLIKMKGFEVIDKAA